MQNVQEITFQDNGGPFPEQIKNLYTSLTVPSEINAHSTAMAYMKSWFLKKFDEKYFKNIYIEGRNILEEFRDFKINEKFKKLKPSLSIAQQPQFDFNRENLDLYGWGINKYVRRSSFESSFFKDFDNNMFLALNLDQLQSNFTFRIRVSTRAQQVDLYKYMKMAFRVGATESDMIDMDCHIPYNLIMQIAKDAGYEVVDDKVVKIVDFVRYLNKHSVMPIIYKYRTANNQYEFYLRLSEMYVNINNLDQLSVDDGEKQGMIDNNFIVEMNTILKIPAPQMYAYYSLTQHNIIKEKASKDHDNIGLYSIEIPKFPTTNNNNWNIYMTTDVIEEDPNKPICIDFKEIFDGSDIGHIIDYVHQMYMSPEIFLDFKLLNNLKPVEYKMDWKNMILTTDLVSRYAMTNVAIYADMNFINQQLINIKQMRNTKFISKGYK